MLGAIDIDWDNDNFGKIKTIKQRRKWYKQQIRNKRREIEKLLNKLRDLPRNYNKK